MKLKALALIVIIIVGFAGYRTFEHQKNTTTSSGNNPNGTSQSTTSFNKSQYSLTDPKSIWLVVDKKRPLNPLTYAPDLTVPSIPLRLSASDGEMHVSSQMAGALEQLVAGAKQDGINLMLASGYRSYALQVSVYGSEVRAYGQTQADLESARPGYSEHQTGFAADLEPTSRECEVSQCFANLPEGKWLAANAYRYGFIIRYPSDKTNITGYEYEPWHVRYVGTALSNEMHKEGITTLEEFFGLPAAPNY